VAAAVLVAVAALVPVWAALVAVVGAGAAAFGCHTLAQTVLQGVPEELKGRVSGLWFWAGSGSKAIAGLTVGALTDVLGPVLGTVATAGLLALTVGLAAALLTQADSPVVPPDPRQALP
jgi:hypothetical protein